MKSLVKAFHSPDAIDLVTMDRKYSPDDFAIFVQVLVGPAEGPGEESFDIMIASPKWLGREVRTRTVLGRYYIFMERWDLPLVERELRRLFEIEGPDWHSIALKLARIGHWEFDDKDWELTY